MKYIIIILSLLFISCEDEQPKEIKCSIDSCKNNEECSINENKIECSCKMGFVKKGDICITKDLCINKECSINEKCNAQNGNCECKNGFTKKDDSCVEDLCKNKQCSTNEKCNAQNGNCDCKEGFTKKDDSCVEDLCKNKQCSTNEMCNTENGNCDCKEGFEKIENICKEKSVSHSYMIYGDNRDHETNRLGIPIVIDSEHPKVVSAMMREINSNPNNIKYIFNSGDLVWDGKDLENKQWNDFFDEIQPFVNAGITYYPVLGNHEHHSEHYYNRFELPGNEQYYHVDLDQIRFIMLDSNSLLTEESEQRIWLVDKLDNLPENIKFIVTIYHHPTFSTGHHGDDGDKTDLRDILHPLLVEKGVDIVFNGHDHAYEHLVADGINYFVTGGGGAILDQTRLSIGDFNYSKKFEGRKYHYILLTIKDNKITIEAKEANGSNSIFDTVVIEGKR